MLITNPFKQTMFTEAEVDVFNAAGAPMESFGYSGWPSKVRQHTWKDGECIVCGCKPNEGFRAFLPCV
jgi:hypothetical protein